MARLEDELADLEGQIARAQSAVKALSASLGKLRTAAQTGALADLQRSLPALAEQGKAAADAAVAVAEWWSFDGKEYLAGGFAAELQEAAAKAGVELIERDGRLSIFPVLLKLEPQSLGVRVGKRLERRLRPSVLVGLLDKIKKQPQRFREQNFLDLLYRTYAHLCGNAWQKGEPRGPLKPLADLHAVLTLLPDSDYSLQEFGRDLLLLDRKPELRTRDGARLLFEGSAISRERVTRINVYDEHGMQHVYIAVRFVREE